VVKSITQLANTNSLCSDSMKWKGKFTSHSIRIGSATEAALAGFSREWIMILGDWSGDSVDRYLRADGRYGKNLTVLLGL